MTRSLASTPELETAHDRGDAERPIKHPIGSIGVTVLKFDVSDWMLRRHGQDPYTSAKLAQLDATREERAQLGALHRHAELGRGRGRARGGPQGRRDHASRSRGCLGAEGGA